MTRTACAPTLVACNGPGEIYEVDADIPGDCDCEGNQLDAQTRRLLRTKTPMASAMTRTTAWAN